jgi:hypothetical protein
MENGNLIGKYDDTTGKGSAEYEVGRYDGHFRDGVPHGHGTLTYKDGSVYEGEWRDDHKNGHGVMSYATGDVYNGQWADDAENGEGSIKYENGDEYTGNWVAGERSGIGTYKYTNGRVYVGNWSNDKRNGIGKLTYPSGNEYEGEWLDNKRHGHGKQIYSNGDEYDGNWVADQKSGQGTMKFESGETYVGPWENDKMHTSPDKPHVRGTYTFAPATPTHGVIESEYVGNMKNGNIEGQGTMTYSDGTVYYGNWVADNRDGHGKLTYPDGTTLYEGNWKNNKPCDKNGTYIFRNGDIYQGNIENNILKGHGVMKQADGTVYDGNWVADKRSGQGTCKYADGDEYTGNWVAGERSGQGTMEFVNGAKYVGPWENDAMHTPLDEPRVRGTYTFAREPHTSGVKRSVYVGQMQHDEFDGIGKMTYDNGDEYHGNWVADIENGHGVMTYANGDKYDGMWDAGLKNGHGEMTYANGDKYEGNWHYGQRHGGRPGAETGTMRYADGRVYEGEWWNDNMHGTGIMTDADGDVIYEGLWRENEQNPLFNPETGELADNTEYNATLPRPRKIFPISDNMLYKNDTYKYKYHDLVELQDRLVLDALEEDPDAIALKVNRTYYVISIDNVVSIANNKNFIQYECPTLVDLDVNQHDLAQVIKTEPYLSIHGMGTQLAGVVPLFDIWSAVKSDHRAFELVATRRELNSTASHHVMFDYGSLVSSNHCQSGIPARVYEVQWLRRQDAPTIKRRKQFTIKNKGTKNLGRIINSGVRKQFYARTQSQSHARTQSQSHARTQSQSHARTQSQSHARTQSQSHARTQSHRH